VRRAARASRVPRPCCDKLAVMHRQDHCHTAMDHTPSCCPSKRMHASLAADETRGFVRRNATTQHTPTPTRLDPAPPDALLTHSLAHSRACMQHAKGTCRLDTLSSLCAVRASLVHCCRRQLTLPRSGGRAGSQHTRPPPSHTTLHSANSPKTTIITTPLPCTAFHTPCVTQSRNHSHMV
jgi:hypothetical protein